MSSSSYIPILAFSWGLAGGFSHCIGMCGVFVAAYTGMPTAKPEQRRIHPERHVMFHLGRLISLTSLGIIGGALGDIGRRWATAQGVLSIAAGLVMLGLALGFAGIVPWFRIPEPNILGAGGGILRRAFVRVLQSDRFVKPLLIGIFVGLLPCGLTYQALIPAALSGSPTFGALTMLLFGLGTVPGLLLLGMFGGTLFGGALMNPKFRNAMTTVAAVIMAVMGVVFIVRGWGNL